MGVSDMQMPAFSVLWWRWISPILGPMMVALPMVWALGHASGLAPSETLTRLEAMAYDARLKMFMPGRLDDRIVIVDIDEASLAQHGRWPWNRQRMAELLEQLLHTQQAAVIGMDVVFAEPDESSGLQRLQTWIAQHHPNDSAWQTAWQPLLDQVDNDERFAQVIQDQAVVLGYYFSSDREGARAGQLPTPLFTDQDLGERRFNATTWNGYGSNLPLFAQAAPQAGFFNPLVDNDGVVRSFPLIARHEKGYYESLALAVYRRYQQLPAVQVHHPDNAPSDYPYLESISLNGPKGQQFIEVDARTASLIPFRGPGGPNGGSFTYISAHDVMAGNLPPGMLEGLIVLIGTTAPGLLDLRATPMSEVYPGVETHANMLSGLLDQRLPVKPDYARGYEITVLLICAAVLLGLRRQQAVWQQTTSLLALTGLIAGLNAWLYVRFQLVLPVASCLLALAMAGSLKMAYGYWVEGQSKRHLADLFGAYVPPELVSQMVQAPDQYSMTASEQALTVMFSDMRGFTRLSESLSPTELQTMLNRVFTELSMAIRSHNGTIDKFMGDCVMAFWGAPIPSTQHARDAVLSALSMRRVMQTLQAHSEEKGWSAIGMGIGIHTGLMCVGDMGSALRRSYTVIGDAVNLGARLESASKFYGVDLVVSQSTRDAAGHGFVWQVLDKVKVKGKTQAITIYTLRGTADAQTATLKAELALWDTVWQAWQDQDPVAAQAPLNALLQMAPDHGLYALYAQRIEAQAVQGKNPMWDGSMALDRK